MAAWPLLAGPCQIQCGRLGLGFWGDLKSMWFSCASQALTFTEDLGTCQNWRAGICMLILPEGLHKKNGSWALSRAQVAREASEGRPLKLGCATTRRARLLGKCIWGLKFLDRPPLPKTYSRGAQIHPKCIFCFCFNEFAVVDVFLFGWGANK